MVVSIFVTAIIQFSMATIARDVVMVIYLQLEIDFVVITKGIFMEHFEMAEQMQNEEMDGANLVIAVIEEDQIDLLSSFVLREFN